MPRLVPSEPIAVYPPPARSFDPVVEAMNRAAQNDYIDSLAKTRDDPYAPEGPFSFYRDLLTLHRGTVRRQGTFDSPRYGGAGPDPANLAPGSFQSEEDAKRRLARSQKQLRDITSSTGSVPDLLRPSMPGRLLEIWGKAARRVSGLVDALPRIPLEAGMVDNADGCPCSGARHRRRGRNAGREFLGHRERSDLERDRGAARLARRPGRRLSPVGRLLPAFDRRRPDRRGSGFGHGHRPLLCVHGRRADRAERQGRGKGDRWDAAKWFLEAPPQCGFFSLGPRG
jgi:hypothetical protein